MSLLFSDTPKTKEHDSQPHQEAKEAGFQAIPYQQTQSEGDQRTTTELIPSAHKDTPCMYPMQGVP